MEEHTLPLPVRRGDLIHYSYEPLAEALDNVPQQPVPQSRTSPYGKPLGLWVSVLGPDDWATWCRNEDFRDTRKQHAVRVNLKPEAKVLRLQTAADLKAFSETWGKPAEFPMSIRGEGWWNVAIQWDKVAATYSGLIIAPYQWSLRLDLGWYYTWDCASGCIWDPAVIESFDVIRERPDAQAAREAEERQRQERRAEFQAMSRSLMAEMTEKPE